MSLFYLKLLGKYLLPPSTIQSIISEFEECHEISQTLLTNKLCSKLEPLGVAAEVVSEVKNEFLVNDMFANCNNGPLKTAAKRFSFFHIFFAFCDQVEVCLGLDDEHKRNTYQYVPICQSIAS